MVACDYSQMLVSQARSMDALGIAEVRATPGLIVREPPLNAVSQTACHHLGIVSESVGCIADEPAAAIQQGHRQVPVIERGERPNAPGKQSIDQAVVKIQAAFIDGA